MRRSQSFRIKLGRRRWVWVKLLDVQPFRTYLLEAVPVWILQLELNRLRLPKTAGHYPTLRGKCLWTWRACHAQREQARYSL